MIEAQPRVEVIIDDDRSTIRRSDAGVVGLAILLGAGLGVVLGALWVAISPRQEIWVVAGQLRVDPMSEALIGAELTFLILATGAGVVATLVACRFWRDQPVGGLIGTVVGGVVGSLSAWKLGLLITGGADGDPGISAVGRADGSTFEGPLQLRALGVLLTWSLVSCVLLSIVASVRRAGARRTLIAVVTPEPSVPESVE